MNLTPTVLRYERHSLVVALVPFGAGQFQNGERSKGWWFLGAESALAAISLGAFVTNFALYGVSSGAAVHRPEQHRRRAVPSGQASIIPRRRRPAG